MRFCFPTTLVILVLYHLRGLASGAQTKDLAPPELSATEDARRPLRIYGWDQSDCEGRKAYTDFDDTELWRNTSTHYIIRSFKLSRALQGSEQLDLSIASSLSTWYPEKDHLSHNSSSCNIFLQSYFANNGSDECHNTPPYTCSRLWLNPGLTR
ncbi:hypothetical protein BJX96DRAFT_20539 [Aspergillus floccosus]